MLKGIIFDMDGTITLTEPLHYEAFNQVFREHGVTDFTVEEEIKRFAGVGSRNTFMQVFKERGIKVSPEEIEKCMAKKKELYKKIVQEAKIEVVAGAQNFIKRVHERGLKKIIATGNSDMQIVRFILEKAGVSEYFPEILSIAEVGRGKPFPDVFVEAAKRIGCAADECVVFEDAINGVKAAKSAKIRCIALATTTSREDLLKAGADAVVKDYNEIKDEILGI
ncbi:HAD family phosphatase [Candidatus Peregrinibacteria bacterium]|nr:HAD family phosphatase [Candidatus Peregrinibacteria bacterium]